MPSTGNSSGHAVGVEEILWTQWANPVVRPEAVFFSTSSLACLNCFAVQASLQRHVFRLSLYVGLGFDYSWFFLILNEKFSPVLLILWLCGAYIVIHMLLCKDFL